MIAWADVSQRVEGIVRALGAGRTIPKPNMWIEVRVDQAGLDGNRAGDGNTEFHRSGFSHSQRGADLFGGWQEFL